MLIDDLRFMFPIVLADLANLFMAAFLSFNQSLRKALPIQRHITRFEIKACHKESFFHFNADAQ